MYADILNTLFNAVLENCMDFKHKVFWMIKQRTQDLRTLSSQLSSYM